MSQQQEHPRLGVED